MVELVFLRTLATGLPAWLELVLLDPRLSQWVMPLQLPLASEVGVCFAGLRVSSCATSTKNGKCAGFRTRTPRARATSRRNRGLGGVRETAEPKQEEAGGVGAWSDRKTTDTSTHVESFYDSLNISWRLCVCVRMRLKTRNQLTPGRKSRYCKRDSAREKIIKTRGPLLMIEASTRGTSSASSLS